MDPQGKSTAWERRSIHIIYTHTSTQTNLVVGAVHVGPYSLQKFQGLHVVRSCRLVARCFALPRKERNVGGRGERKCWLFWGER